MYTTLLSARTHVFPKFTPVIYMSTVVYLVLAEMSFYTASGIAVSSEAPIPGISSHRLLFVIHWRTVGIIDSVFIDCIGAGAIFIG